MQMFNEEDDLEVEDVAEVSDNPVVDDTEEPTQDTAETEVESGDTAQTDDRKQRADRQIDRLKARIKELESKGAETTPKAEVDYDLINRTYLETKGFTDDEVQDKAIERAKKLGMSVHQLLKDEDERAILEAKAQRAKAAQASARPTGRGGATKKDAQWYADHGVLPEDPKLIPQVWQILADKERG